MLDCCKIDRKIVRDRNAYAKDLQKIDVKLEKKFEISTHFFYTPKLNQ